MSRVSHIKDELVQIRTVEELTEAFEGIASIHIAKIRDRVVASKEFFSLLWPTYRGLRVNPRERLMRLNRSKGDRSVFVAITSDASLNSDITERIISALVEAYGTAKNTDIMVVGERGVQELHRHGLPIVNSFPMPVRDSDINVNAMIRELNDYNQISVFYQTYESLRVQRVARIDLISAVRSLGEAEGEEGETLSSKDYTFEPSIAEIADYMESVMMGVALIQVVMESKLAGHAARFNAMSRAKRRAKELSEDFTLDYHRARRSVSDERLKEIMKVVKTNEHRWAS